MSEALKQFAVHVSEAGHTPRPKAQRGQRFIAALLDGFFSSILSGAGVALITKGLGANTLSVKLLWFGMFPMIYHVLPLFASGQTLGKKLMKVRVVDATSEGELSFGQAMLREYVGKYFSAVVFCLGYVRILTHPDGRAWHDSMACTRVVSLVEE